MSHCLFCCVFFLQAILDSLNMYSKFRKWPCVRVLLKRDEFKFGSHSHVKTKWVSAWADPNEAVDLRFMRKPDAS